MDSVFCEPDNAEHKHRRSSLKAALIKSLPKPDGLKTVTAITTARGALLHLADYALWQFFCGSRGSGSSKLNMSHKMPIIYNIVLVVVQKVMNVTEKDAATAVSTFLKNTKNRSSARKYLQKLRGSSAVTSNNQEGTAETTAESADDEATAVSTGDGSQLDDCSESAASTPEDSSDDGSSVEPDTDEDTDDKD